MLVTVFGSARLTEDSEDYRGAMRLGALLAKRGDTLMSGGYGGLMEAVSRGAREEGGTVVGITLTPWANRLQANAYLSEERAAETLFARIEGLLESDCLIALNGGAGTLGEIALAWNMSQMDLMPRKPIILVGPTWQAMVKAFRDNLVIGDHDLALLTCVDTIDEALLVLDPPPAVAHPGDFRG